MSRCRSGRPQYLSVNPAPLSAWEAKHKNEIWFLSHTSFYSYRISGDRGQGGHIALAVYPVEEISNAGIGDGTVRIIEVAVYLSSVRASAGVRCMVECLSGAVAAVPGAEAFHKVKLPSVHLQHFIARIGSAV